MKKNDRVKFKHNGVELVGTVISNPYRMVTEKEDYIDIWFDGLKDQLPVNVKYLEVLECIK